MSTHADILDVHKAESKLRLKPHLVPVGAPDGVQLSGPLRVTLAELFTPELVATLREMKLL